MRHIIRPLVLGVLLAGAPSLLSAAPSTLCSPGEEVVFSCRTKRKSYEICASRDLSATSGYMQYRAGSNGKVEFVYPDKRVVPAGRFRYSLLARGAELTFRNGEFTYNIVEPLIGQTSIWVLRGNATVAAPIDCLNRTESLTLTSTLNRFKSLGIYE